MLRKILLKLFNLGELVVGAALFLFGFSGLFNYFILNALLCLMGFFVFIDALSGVDNPQNRKETPIDENAQSEQNENPSN